MSTGSGFIVYGGPDKNSFYIVQQLVNCLKLHGSYTHTAQWTCLFISKHSLHINARDQYSRFLIHMSYGH